MFKVSIIMPAYNEERRIEKTLKSYSSYFEDLRKKGKVNYKIIVVINNTTDRTEEIVKMFKKSNERISYLNLKQKGKGFAIIQGFKEALKDKQDLIGFVDADLATRPEEYAKLIFSMKNYDGIVASRYIKGATINPLPSLQRRIAKRMFNSLVRILLFLPYKDTQCGAKIFKREVVKKSVDSLSMSQWAFDVELLYAFKKKGFKIKEIATRWFDKEYSTINFWRSGPWMALGVIRLRLLNSPLKTIMRIYDKIIIYVPR